MIMQVFKTATSNDLSRLRSSETVRKLEGEDLSPTFPIGDTFDRFRGFTYSKRVFEQATVRNKKNLPLVHVTYGY